MDRAQVEKIAHLARIALDEQHADSLAGDLTSILALVDQLDAADTAKVEPMAHPLEMTQRLRVDQVSESDRRETFQTVAPATENGLYLVPKVIE